MAGVSVVSVCNDQARWESRGQKEKKGCAGLWKDYQYCSALFYFDLFAAFLLLLSSHEALLAKTKGNGCQ